MQALTVAKWTRDTFPCAASFRSLELFLYCHYHLQFQCTSRSTGLKWCIDKDFYVSLVVKFQNCQNLWIEESLSVWQFVSHVTTMVKTLVHFLQDFAFICCKILLVFFFAVFAVVFAWQNHKVSEIFCPTAKFS